ncbi:Uncharacterized protein APZ42_014574 [Daphnia magna]|uniref:Uncharacterized protein n=1 Tax=Daphnia magna TaxID=35525 RepID=A0A0P6ATU9_9CRUS|nr:Uncharacterized protein APZ42_014574 [Daphnia magna]
MLDINFDDEADMAGESETIALLSRSLLAASVLRSVKHPTHGGMIQQIRKTNGLQFNLSNQNRMH